jgi:uncharacterized repeat protein (TIGR01451 family)
LAVLSGGNQETGPLTFTLLAPDGSVVDTETVQVNGDGKYPTANTNIATQVGTYTWQASYAGDAQNNPASDQGGAAEQVVKASPTLVTTASFQTGNSIAGSAIPGDSAVLSGGYQESGTLTFTLTAPDKSIVDTETVTPNGNGTYSTSNAIIATQVGTYTWSVIYAGDGFNNAASDQGGAAEQLTTIKASPSITTTAGETAGGLVGSAVLSDSATISGGDSPTGTVTFSLTAPDGTTSQVGSGVNVTGDGTYVPSTTVLATEVGAYSWHVTYSGDGLNNGAVDDGANESLTTVKASPTITTSASETVGGVVGSAVLIDSVTVAGGDNPTGAVTFSLTAPDGTTSTIGSVTIAGDNAYTSPTVVATEVGTYTWHASYSGDGLNSGAVDNGANESLTTIKASPSITTSASETAGGVVGTAVLSDSVTVAGGDNPSGTVTFTLTRPDGSVISAGSVSVSGDGTYSDTTTVVATQVGTYTWHATYGGDGLNNGENDNGINESLTAIKASPSITTSATETAGGVVGSAVLSDSVTVVGGDGPTGTVTFTLTAPDGTTSPVGSAINVTGDGAYLPSTTVVATEVGPYTWHAYYSGDVFNNGATDNGSNESLTSIKASPTISTVASTGGTVGSASVYDTATLAGGYNETGGILFTLYDSTNTAVFTSTKPAAGNSAVTSASFAPTSAGTYHWSAVYAGDSNNNGTNDNGVNESLTMTWANPLPAGTWTPLGHTAPGGIGTMELLTDGTVLALSGDNYYKLTPDSTGSYVNGTWSQLASPNLQRLYDATNVLTDGRVFVLGGEYTGPNNTGSWANSGEIYNPVTNSWSNIPNFPLDSFGDDPSMLLPDGRVLAANINGPSTYIYDPVSNSWSTGPTKLYGDRSDEETWVKLSDGSILQYDIWGNTQEAQRLDPSTMTWVDAGHVPVPLDSGDEIGPAVLLADGRVFQIGATSNTALYTPATTPGSTGTWAAGPVIPGGLIGSDACAAMMPNGDVLLAVSSNLSGGNSTKLYEFDPAANTLTDVTQGASANRMLALPSGQVLAANGSSQLSVYTPTGSPQAAWKPTISSVVPKGSNFTLTGTQLNGISAGASFGDDAEMDTNYPIVELKNTSGQVYFARTFNWGTGVATGNTLVSTDFSLPANMPYGTYSLSVVANGIGSAPVSFTGGIVGSSADLVVTDNGATASTEGSNVTYNLVVTNNGPTSTTNVVLTDTLDPNMKYVSATTGQGTFSQSGSVVTFSIGSLAVGQSVTATVTGQIIDSGHLVNTASVTSALSDANLNNNTCSAITVVADSAITVSAPIVTTSATLTNQTVATFTHASGVEPTSDFIATITWGDGSTSLGTISVSSSTYSVKGSHTYSQGGSYTISTAVQELPSGPWSRVSNFAPTGTLSTMELLTDGSVMVFASNNTIYKLTPDATGSYANGTWSQLASMNLARVSDATNVLPDGRVLVLGGQYTGPNLGQTYTNTGEIYDPVANTWTNIAPFPEANFGNDPTMLLPNGRILAGSKTGPQTYIYDPTTNTWTSGPTKLFNDESWGEPWTKLADGSILSYDIWNNVGEAQRLDPTTMTWIDSGTVPVTLQVPGRAVGPAVLLADGRVLQLGGMGAVNGPNTAIYTPATTPGGTGSWTAGPTIPNELASRLAAAALLRNGHVLFTAGQLPIGVYDFDPNAPIATSIATVTPSTPDLTGQTASLTRMLVLPTGQILFAGAPTAGELDLYTPTGSPQAAWKPAISGVTNNGNGTYTLTGTQLNGLSAGASFNFGAEMASNYPIIELSNAAGKVYFARTFNWSSTSVATGSTPVSTSFSLPVYMPYGTYSLTVIANGIASSPVSFTGGTTGSSADLALTFNAPTTSPEGNNITYNLAVTNNGPTTATNVVLTDTLGANLTYVSATKSQGTVTQSGSNVTFSIGSVAVGQTIYATVTAQSMEDVNVTNSASVTGSPTDGNLNNNSVVATTAVAEPAISVSGPVYASGKKQNNVTVATFTHANGVEPASAFVATINWGDGTTSAGTISLSGTTYTVKGSHTYAANGLYTVTTTVAEAGSSPNLAIAGGSTTNATASASAATPTGPASDPASNLINARASNPGNAHDAVFAIIAENADWASLTTGKWNWAGAESAADADRSDAVLELLSGLESDILV